MVKGLYAQGMKASEIEMRLIQSPEVDRDLTTDNLNQKLNVNPPVTAFAL